MTEYYGEGYSSAGDAGLRSEVSELSTTVTDLESFKSGAEQQLDDLGGDVRELELDMQSVLRAVRRLAGRVGWLEQRLVASGAAELVDLDAVDGDLRRLAAAAESGREAEAGLMPSAHRAAREQLVARFETAKRQRDAAQQLVLESSGHLANLPVTAGQHRDAAEGFTTVGGRLKAAQRTVGELSASAGDAARALAEDDAARARVEERITAGRDAATALATRLRTRLIEVVGREDALLPGWFSLELGSGPGSADVAQWAALGARVLAYRITYGITDRQRALGAGPGAGAPEWRRQEHLALRQALDDLG